MTDTRELNNTKLQLKQKRKRTVIVPAQFNILEGSFQANQWPNKTEKGILARKLRMSERIVSIWFQNRRARARREEEKANSNEESNSIDAQERKRKALESCVHEVDIASIKHQICPAQNRESEIKSTKVTKDYPAGQPSACTSSTHLSPYQTSNELTLQKANKLSPTEIGQQCKRLILKSSGPSPSFLKRKIMKRKSGILRKMTKNVPCSKTDRIRRGIESISPSNCVSTEVKPVLKSAMNARVRPRPIPRFKWEMKTFMQRNRKKTIKSPIKFHQDNPVMISCCCCQNNILPPGSQAMGESDSGMSQNVSNGSSKHTSELGQNPWMSNSKKSQQSQRVTTMHNLPTRSGYSSKSLQNSTTPRNKPTLFHAIINMIAIVERGIISKDDSEFGQAVTDALYGMQINRNTRLIYDTLDGLELVKMND